MIHLIVGSTGAGKTTYSNNLKLKNKGVIFSIDKWNKALFFPDKTPNDGLEWFLERIERAETLIMHLIEQLEVAGTDAILDLGLSKYEHRQKFKTFANAHDFELTTHFLDISKETRLERVMKRNHKKGDTFEFEVTQENFDFMESWFEKPSKEEMKGGIHVRE